MHNKLTDVTMIDSRDDWFEAGRSNEDNTEIVGTAYYLVAETNDGFRWAHDHTFCSGEMVYDDMGFNSWTQDHDKDRASLKALKYKVLAHLAAGGSLNPEHWHPIQGCYGSMAWDEQAEIEAEAYDGCM